MYNVIGQFFVAFLGLKKVGLSLFSTHLNTVDSACFRNCRNISTEIANRYCFGALGAIVRDLQQCF